MVLIELSEWCGINLHDSRLCKGVCSDVLVVCRVIGNVKDSSLACYSLTWPCKVSSFGTESSVLAVSMASADWVDTFLANSSVCGRSGKFILALRAESLSQST